MKPITPALPLPLSRRQVGCRVSNCSCVKFTRDVVEWKLHNDLGDEIQWRASRRDALVTAFATRLLAAWLRTMPRTIANMLSVDIDHMVSSTEFEMQY
jgi:hypothetical protein